MTRKNKTLLIFSCILGVLLVIGVLLVVSINSFKKYVEEKLAYNVRGKILNSKVLRNKIGEVESLEFKLFPVFYYSYDNMVTYEAKLSYEVTTKEGKNYIILVYLDGRYYYDDVYAYQIGDDFIFETLYFSEYNKNEFIENDFNIMIDEEQSLVD